MAILDYWHPVLSSRELPRDRPIAVRLGGRRLALFRVGPGQVGAVDDVCPHRRLRLSVGKIRDGRLHCAYHGWSFDACGQGESPGTPKLRACAGAYDCREAHGAIWVKGRGDDRPLPVIDHGDFIPVGVVTHRVPAPLELTLDNFSEVEHTLAIHDAFGIDPQRGAEAVVHIDATATTVTVRNAGPAKAPHALTRLFLLFRRRFLFHSDYTIYFDPPRTVVDHYWTDPVGGGEAMAKYRLYHFFTPEDDRTTRLLTFGAAKSRWPLVPGGGVPLFGWYLLKAIADVIDEDVWLLENLADRTAGLEGMHLGRFDRVLGLNRERLRRVYYGDAGAAGLSRKALGTSS